MPRQWFIQFDEGAAVRRIERDGAEPVAPPAGYVEVTEAEWDAAPLAVLPSRRLSKFTFLRLLTPAEYAAMLTQTDPLLAYGVACFQAAPDPFDIDDPLVGQMLGYCVASGVLTQARRDALWAAMEQAARAN
jgi:hypothetical protein